MSLSIILLGSFSVTISHDNAVTAKKSSSNSSIKNLQQIPSNSTDFPSTDDASTIQLTYLKPSKDFIGTYHIKGEIKNMGNDTLSFVEVKSHFYDANMNIISVENGFTDPTDINLGQTGNFDIMLMKDSYGSTPPAFFKLSYDWK